MLLYFINGQATNGKEVLDCMKENDERRDWLNYSVTELDDNNEAQ